MRIGPYSYKLIFGEMKSNNRGGTVYLQLGISGRYSINGCGGWREGHTLVEAVYSIERVRTMSEGAVFFLTLQ